MAADEVIVVTPDPTSIMDAYTMIKTLINTLWEQPNVVTNMVNNKGGNYNFIVEYGCK